MADARGIKMIGYILLCILLIVVISVAIFFVFCILLPALSQQQSVDSDPVFSFYEIDTLSVQSGFIQNKATKKAVILCSHERSVQNRMEYNGFTDCRFFKNLYETENDCRFGCTGFGSCVDSCPQNAIKIVNHTAVITEMCNGCGKCVDVCPYHLISLIPVQSEFFIPCSSKEGVYSNCSKACTGCNECVEQTENKYPIDNNYQLPVLLNSEEVAKTGGKCKNKCLTKYEPYHDNTYTFWSKIRKLVSRKKKESISIIWE